MACYVTIGNIEVTNIDEENYNKKEFLKVGAVRTRTNEALDRRKKNLENILEIKNFITTNCIGEKEEKSIHKILQSNPYTKDFGVDIKYGVRTLTEYYEPNNIIKEAVKFLIERLIMFNNSNIKKWIELEKKEISTLEEKFSHLLTRYLDLKKMI